MLWHFLNYLSRNSTSHIPNKMRILIGFFFLFIILAQSSISCKTSPKVKFSIPGIDSTIKATRISFSDLSRNYKSYHGQYVETTGRFYAAFEQFAIYPKQKLRTRNEKGFWLNLDSDLYIDDKSFGKMQGKRVTIKGRIDTTHKGHLSYYLATIEKTYFWQQY